MASIGCTHTTGWTTLWTEILLLKLHLKQRGPVFWFDLNIRRKATLHYLKHKLTGGNKRQGLPVRSCSFFYSFQIQGISSVSHDAP